MAEIIELRRDSKGEEIKLHDVLINELNGEMALVVYGENTAGVKGLAVENNMIGISDWLDVYPDGIWTIVGNFAKSGDIE